MEAEEMKISRIDIIGQNGPTGEHYDRPPLTTTTLVCAIHRRGDDPYCGESATHVCLVHEGAGPFIELRQHAHAEPGTVKLCLDEMECVADVARMMIRDYPREANNG